jgi:DNA-directed RNA polymerase specialized sigma24 family protein
MKIDQKELKRLIEGVKRGKYEDYLKLKEMFIDYTNNLYERYIGRSCGNKYYFDYITMVEDEVLNGIDEFEGVDPKQFCAYINVLIKNCCLRFLRDYVKPSYKIRSLNECYESTNITKYSSDMIRVEEYVIVKITNEELIYKELMPRLSKKQRGALQCQLSEVETIEEYAKRKKYKESTVRSYVSKAIKKLRNNPDKNKLAKKYMINF